MMKILTLTIFLFLFSGCSKQIMYPAYYPGTSSQDTNETAQITPIQNNSQIEDDQTSEPLEKLYAEYKKWQNTPYRYGSTGMGGTDCSGFVQAIYKDAFNMQIPRDSSNQVLQGSEVKSSELKPGDLVFFRINAHLRHVGIYIGRNTFMHSATKGGVRLSNLNEAYWKQRYWTSRRMLTAGTYTAQN